MHCDLFVVGAAQIPGWWIWVYWGINPISYAQKAMAINEFGAPRWQSILAADGKTTVGNAILAQRGLPTEDWWIWVGVAVLVFSIAQYNVLIWLCHAYLQREIPFPCPFHCRLESCLEKAIPM